MVGSGNVYFLKAPGLPQQCVANKPLTYRNIGVQRIHSGDGFDLVTWARTGGSAYNVTVEAGLLTSTQAGGSAY